MEVQCGFAVKQEIDGHKIEEVQGYFKGTKIKKGGLSWQRDQRFTNVVFAVILLK